MISHCMNNAPAHRAYAVLEPTLTACQSRDVALGVDEAYLVVVPIRHKQRAYRNTQHGLKGVGPTPSMA